jgi:hypothetical protein
MTQSNRDRVSEVMDALKEGLGPFVLREYKQYHKGARYLQEIELTLKSGAYSTPHLPDEAAALAKVDIHGWLNLMVRQWNDVFRTRLGKAERSFVGELQEARNDWAHQKTFINDDVMRVADTATRLLESVGAAKEAEITRNIKKEAHRLSYEAEMQQAKKPTSPLLDEVPTTARDSLPQMMRETIPVKIMRAVAILVLQEGKKEFSREEIPQKIGVEREEWDASYSPTFQGMRVDQPGGAPNVGAKFKGVFRQIRHGVHTLTDDGNRLLAEFKAHDLPSAVEQATAKVRAEATSVLEFDNDEEGYLQWVNANPLGFVINASKQPGDYGMLHKATCPFISTRQRTNYTTTTYMKICSVHRQELIFWGDKNSDKFQLCKHCKP